MADAVTNFSGLSTDAPNVWISQQMYRLAERQLRLGAYAEKYQLPQRFGKTFRIVRYKRLALPTTTLTEGTPPDAVALTIENVDVTVEQWGIVTLLTDVVQITTTHPALTKATELVGLAMAEMIEREIAGVLLAGTSVIYGGAATARSGLAATDKMTTTVVLKTSAQLRTYGAPEWDGSLYAGVIHPNVEADLLAADAVFQAASNFANVRALQQGEIGIWMGVRWMRGNFLPAFKGVATTDTAAVTASKAQVTAVDGGGTIVSATNFKFATVARDINSNYERLISQDSANIASAATANNESFTVALPTSTNYTYDIYMTIAGGAGSLFKVASRQAASSTYTITAVPAGTEAVKPVAPANTVATYVCFVTGKDAYGRVELNGMSLQSFITPAGPSYSNPLAQGRKVGAKVMFKAMILDNTYFTRIEVGSAFADLLPA